MPLATYATTCPACCKRIDRGARIKLLRGRAQHEVCPPPAVGDWPNLGLPDSRLPKNRKVEPCARCGGDVAAYFGVPVECRSCAEHPEGRGLHYVHDYKERAACDAERRRRDEARRTPAVAPERSTGAAA